MCFRPRFTHFALGLLCLCLLTRPAWAGEDFERVFSQALRLYDNLEYEAALSQLQQARKLPHDDSWEVKVSLYEGAILANLNRWDGARRAFRAALLKDPDAKLLLLAPKVQKELEATRTRVRKELGLTKGHDPKAHTPAASPTSGTDSDTTAPSVAPPPSKDRPEQPLPASLVPPTTAAAPQALTPTVEETRRRPVPTVSLVLLGAGVVAGGAGSYLGWTSRRQVDSARVASLQTDAAARLAHARGDARAANFLWGGAGVAIAGAALSWWLMREPGEQVVQGGAR